MRFSRISAKLVPRGTSMADEMALIPRRPEKPALQCLRTCSARDAARRPISQSIAEAA